MSDDENLYAPEGPRYSFDDTETIILNTASQREDGMVLPIPESITANPEQVRRKLKRLIKAGILQEVPAKLEDGLWRKDKDDRHLTLELTTEGRRRALNLFDEGPGPAQSEAGRSKSRSAGEDLPAKHDVQTSRRHRKSAASATATSAETRNASRVTDKAKGWRKSTASTRMPSTAKKALKLAPRQSKSRQPTKESKGARLLATLSRGKGATLEELMKLSGWQAHSVRGFLSGNVKKKLKLKLRTEVDGKGVRRYCVATKRTSS